MSAMANWWGSIRDLGAQIKSLFDDIEDSVFVVLLVIFVGIAAFGLGRLSSQEDVRPPVRMVELEVFDEEPMRIGGKYVASRKGTKYHFPWCAGAQAMNEQNKIWFDTIEEAQAAGYTPAGNCEGLK